MINAVIFDLDNTLLDFMKMKSMSVDAGINGMIEAGLDINFQEAKTEIYKIYENISGSYDIAYIKDNKFNIIKHTV